MFSYLKVLGQHQISKKLFFGGLFPGQVQEDN